jgi:5-methylcytosine-specific restriction endonuclease McrA
MRRWFPVDLGHWASHYNALNTEQFGAFFLLAMEYWQFGNLPEDDRDLAAITRLSVRRWRKMRPSIECYYEMPGWKNSYFDSVIAKAEKGYAKKLAYYKTLDERRPSPLQWAEIRSRIFKRDNFTCVYCGQRGGNLHCDHVIPISRDGSNADDNLATSCEPCNMSKGTKLVSEWLH